MKRSRFGIGQTPSGNPFRKSRHVIERRLSERERETCFRCHATRWEHEKKQGLVPDHLFVERTTSDAAD